MTEIKLRAWCEKHKEMYYSKDDNNYRFIIYDNCIGYYPKYNKDELYHFNTEPGVHEIKIEVSLYTGHGDKNGKNIYNGDILSDKWKVEVYQNLEGTYMVKFHNNPTINKTRSLFQYLKARTKAGTSDRDCIIIGNIYENPELLNQINK